VLQSYFGEELPLGDLDCPNVDVMLHKLPREFLVDQCSSNGKCVFFEDCVVLCISRSVNQCFFKWPK